MAKSNTLRAEERSSGLLDWQQHTHCHINIYYLIIPSVRRSNSVIGVPPPPQRHQSQIPSADPLDRNQPDESGEPSTRAVCNRVSASVAMALTFFISRPLIPKKLAICTI